MTDKLDSLLTTGKQFFTKNSGNVYEFYLSGEIEEATEYTEWFDIIRNARATDTVKIYINSGGGDLYTALQFLRVLSETEAHVITSVEGACMSAATMIFLHGDEFEVTPHSLFMFHNYSAGVFGKGGEMFDQLQFERAWSENFLREVYHDFLTTDEIKSMLDNKDIWMTSEQVLARIDIVLAKMASLQELHEESVATVE
jgi:ATP-dependent protease ClpP protease subunit